MQLSKCVNISGRSCVLGITEVLTAYFLLSKRVSCCGPRKQRISRSEAMASRLSGEACSLGNGMMWLVEPDNFQQPMSSNYL